MFLDHKKGGGFLSLALQRSYRHPLVICCLSKPGGGGGTS